MEAAAPVSKNAMTGKGFDYLETQRGMVVIGTGWVRNEGPEVAKIPLMPVVTNCSSSSELEKSLSLSMT